MKTWTGRILDETFCAAMDRDKWKKLVYGAANLFEWAQWGVSMSQ